ncbi:hypothetical protein EB796_015952 [Bugula neritina]|uniref:EF-hand domain-containing protein n=1 Tax=Bugula neritina TaxID=10212 RepID=A0A7J7JJ86_BUGNE|nr:hypothetical protein EB796_015952 [Bugula neritina]
MAESSRPNPLRLALSDGSRNVLIECFKQFDKNGDGKINVEELPAALNFVGVHPTEEDTKDILRLLDKQGDGNLEITELVDNYKILAQHSVNCEELLDAFNRLDTNKDGFLNLLELKKVLTGAGEKWTQEEASQLLQDLMKYDMNGDGKFDYVEFVTMYMDNSYPFKKPEVSRIKINETYRMEKKKQKPESDTVQSKPDT